MSRERPTEVTDHAVERYVERWRPDIQEAIDRLYDEARADLERMVVLAQFKGDLDGEALWAVPAPTPCLVGKQPRDRRLDRSTTPLLLCERDGKFSTVLSPGSRAPNRRPQK